MNLNGAGYESLTRPNPHDPLTPNSGMIDHRKDNLTVEIKDGRLLIAIGVETLAFAITHNPELKINVTDPDGFANDLLSNLEREQEDGTTPVHLLLDKAANEAAENGSEFIKLDDEP